MSAYEKINILKLSISGKLSYFPIAQFFVQETAKMFGFEGDDLYKIVLYTDVAKDIRDYVRSHDPNLAAG